MMKMKISRSIVTEIRRILTEEEPVAEKIANNEDCFVGLLAKTKRSLQEVKGRNYKRIRLNWRFNNVAFCFENKFQVVFPKASKSWGSITHFGIFDSETGGNLLKKGVINTFCGVKIARGTTAIFEPGQLSLQLE